jgi:hypothetical protein
MADVSGESLPPTDLEEAPQEPEPAEELMGGSTVILPVPVGDMGEL